MTQRLIEIVQAKNGCSQKAVVGRYGIASLCDGICLGCQVFVSDSSPVALDLPSGCLTSDNILRKASDFVVIRVDSTPNVTA